MKPRDRFLTALRRGQPDRVPWGESWIDAALAVRILGREKYDIFDLLARLGIASTIGRVDSPIFAETRTGADGTLYYTRGLVRTRADLEDARFPAPDAATLLRPVAELVERNPGDYAIGARIRLGVHATTLSMGLEGLSFALVDDPGLVRDLFRRYVDWTLPIIKRITETGADFIWNGDDIAYKTGPMISPARFRSIFMPGLRELADAIRATGLPWIYHSDGDLSLLMEDLLSLGMQGLHPFEPGAMDIVACKQRFGSRICILGNVSLDTLGRGTPDEVRAEVRTLLEQVGPGGGYIITSGNTLAHYCKVENVLAMRDAIHDYGNYSGLGGGAQ